MSFALPPNKVGSKDWILKEEKLAADLVSNDLEDFAFSARRELEWINEHLMELMDPAANPRRDVASLFQTPGKIRAFRSPIKLPPTSENMQENIDPNTGRASNLHVKFDTLDSNIIKTPATTYISPLKSKNVSFPASNAVDNQINTPLTRTSHSEYDDSDLNGSFLAISRSVNKSAQSKISSANPSSTSAAGTISNAHSTPLLTSNPQTPGYTLDLSSNHSKTVESSSLKGSSVLGAEQSPINLVSLPTRVPLPKKSSASAIGSAHSNSTEVSETKNETKSQIELSRSYVDTSKDQTTSSRSQQSDIEPPKEPAINETSEETPAESETQSGSFVEVLKRATRFMFDRPDSSKSNNSRPVSKPSANVSRIPQSGETPNKPASRSIFERLATPTFASSSKISGSSSPVRSLLHSSPSKELKNPMKTNLSPVKVRPISQKSEFESKSGVRRAVSKEMEGKSSETIEKNATQKKETEKNDSQKNETIHTDTTAIKKINNQKTISSETPGNSKKPSGLPVSVKSSPTRSGYKSPIKDISPVKVSDSIKPKIKGPINENMKSDGSAKENMKPTNSLKEKSKSLKDSGNSVNDNMKTDNHSELIKTTTTISSSDLMNSTSSINDLAKPMSDTTKPNNKLTSHALQPKKPKIIQKPSVKSSVNSTKTVDSSAAETISSTHSTTNNPPTNNQPKISRSLARTSLSVKSNPKAKQMKQEKMKAVNASNSTLQSTTISSHHSSKLNSASQDTKPRPKLMNSIPEISRYHQSGHLGSSKKRSSETEIDTPLQHKHKQPRINQLKGSSLVKAAVLGSAKMNGLPMVDGVKISNDKLKFSKPDNNQTPSRTTQNSSLKLRLNLAKMNKNTPESGDNIVLPEIMSESEDDEEGNILQDWANSPELRALLDRQQKIDPDAIFGPIPTLKMEEVFEKSSRLSRLRPRSSSANWSGQDKLTQQEIEKYSAGMGYMK